MEDIQTHNHDGITSPKISPYNVIQTYTMTSAELLSFLGRNAIEGDEFNVYVSDANEYYKYVRINSNWVIVNTDNLVNYFGDGRDGDVVISTNTSLASDKYYNNLTVNNGIVLNPNGYRIFVKNSTIFVGTGKIARDGNSGSGVTGGAALADGTIKGGLAGGNGGNGGEYSGGGSSGYAGTNGGASTSIMNIGGASGGQGGDAVDGVKIGGAGGTGGTATSETASFENRENTTITTITLDTELNQYISNISMVKGSTSNDTLSNSGGAGGGGGGATDGNSRVGGTGGGGGGAGGIIYLASKNIITNTNEYISAKGGNGADGEDAPTGVALNTGGGGGGGGGGNGGLIILIYRTLSGTGTINLTKGTAGTGGAKGQNNTATVGEGRDGTNGSDGKYIKIKII